MAKRTRKAGRAKSPAKKAKPRIAKTKAPKGPSGSTISVVCSECYGDFVFNMAASGDQITCPECMHVGITPDPAEKSTFAGAVANTRSKLISAIVPAVIFAATGYYYISSLNGAGSFAKLGSGMNYGLLGILAVTFIATIMMGIRYEKNRSEVYF